MVRLSKKKTQPRKVISKKRPRRKTNKKTMKKGYGKKMNKKSMKGGGDRRVLIDEILGLGFVDLDEKKLRSITGCNKDHTISTEKDECKKFLEHLQVMLDYVIELAEQKSFTNDNKIITVDKIKKIITFPKNDLNDMYEHANIHKPFNKERFTTFITKYIKKPFDIRTTDIRILNLLNLMAKDIRHGMKEQSTPAVSTNNGSMQNTSTKPSTHNNPDSMNTRPEEKRTIYKCKINGKTDYTYDEKYDCSDGTGGEVVVVDLDSLHPSLDKEEYEKAEKILEEKLKIEEKREEAKRAMEALKAAAKNSSFGSSPSN